MRLSKNAQFPRVRSVVGTPLSSISPSSASRGRFRARNRWAPELVRLEDRQLLATFTVSNTLDAANNNIPVTGSLRWAVDQAAAAGGAGVVDFSSSVFNTPQTITLTQLLTPIQINTPATSITINGPGTGLLTINGGGDGTVFEVDAGVVGDDRGHDDHRSLAGRQCRRRRSWLFDDEQLHIHQQCDEWPVCGEHRATVSNCFFLNDNSYFGAGIYVKGGTASITNCTTQRQHGQFRAVGAGVCNQEWHDDPDRLHAQRRFALGSGGGGLITRVRSW